MEQKKVKKKAGLFRSVSSLSTSSRRNDGEKSDEKKSALERIRLSVGRRSVEDFSNHPISVLHDFIKYLGLFYKQKLKCCTIFEKVL